MNNMFFFVNKGSGSGIFPDPDPGDPKRPDPDPDPQHWSKVLTLLFPPYVHKLDRIHIHVGKTNFSTWRQSVRTVFWATTPCMHYVPRKQGRGGEKGNLLFTS